MAGVSRIGRHATLQSMHSTTTARWILIASLAFVFGYFGIDKFIHPDLWVGWMPTRIEGFLGMTSYRWLSVFGVIEIASAIGLLIPIRRLQQFAALGMIIQLIGILTQTGWNEIAVRDINILLSAIALLALL